MMRMLALLALLVWSSLAVDPEDRKTVIVPEPPKRSCGFGGHLVGSTASSPVVLKKNPIPINTNCEEEYAVPASAAVMVQLKMSLSGQPRNRCKGNFFAIQYPQKRDVRCGDIANMGIRIDEMGEPWTLKFSLLTGNSKGDWIDSTMYLEMQAPPVPPPKAYFECGVVASPTRVVTNRIVGGMELGKEDTIPWHIGVLMKPYTMKPEFSAVLVSPRHGLTVAHRIDGKNQDHMRVLVGQHNIAKVKDADLYPVLCGIVHEKYNMRTGAWNFAILVLENPVKFGPRVAAACLPKPNTNFEGWMLTVSGWGTRNHDVSEMTDVLHHAKVPVVPNEQCEQAYANIFLISADMICAGFMGKGGIDTCKGDGGGPMTGIVDGKATVIGLTAKGRLCGHWKYPGVYSRVSKIDQWMKQNGIYDKNAKCPQNPIKF